MRLIVPSSAHAVTMATIPNRITGGRHAQVLTAGSSSVSPSSGRAPRSERLPPGQPRAARVGRSPCALRRPSRIGRCHDGHDRLPCRFRKSVPPGADQCEVWVVGACRVGTRSGTAARIAGTLGTAVVSARKCRWLRVSSTASQAGSCRFQTRSPDVAWRLARAAFSLTHRGNRAASLRGCRRTALPGTAPHRARAAVTMADAGVRRSPGTGRPWRRWPMFWTIESAMRVAVGEELGRGWAVSIRSPTTGWDPLPSPWPPWPA